jgi:hypothetical protein
LIIISAILTDFGGPSQRQCSDEIIANNDIVNEEDNVAYPSSLMDDIVMSEQGSKESASNNEEILEFPELDKDEGHALVDVEMDPVMPDLDVLDMVVPDLVEPNLESYTSIKVTQVGVRIEIEGPAC